MTLVTFASKMLLHEELCEDKSSVVHVKNMPCAVVEYDFCSILYSLAMDQDIENKTH